MCAATATGKPAIKPATVPSDLDQTDWHALEQHDVCLLLEVDPKVGLTPAEVSKRQLRHGLNSLQRIESRVYSSISLQAS